VINYWALLKTKLGLNKGTVTEMLHDSWTEDREYYLISHEDWNTYERELEGMHPVMYNFYKKFGYPKIAYRQRHKSLRLDLKRGIPCLTFRGLPVVDEKYREKVLKIYANN
jgi:hypothetical protein